MARRGEAEELVRLWQRLQEAQVAGDLEGLASLRRYAELESKRPDASDEWRLLAREAGRHAERRHEEREEQPSVVVAGETVPPDAVPAPDREPASEPEPEPAAGRSGRRRIGGLIWIAILVAWVALQILQGGGDGSP